MRQFTANALLASLLLAGIVMAGISQRNGRGPSSNGPDYELHLRALSLDGASRLHSLDKAFLRVTFDGKEAFDFIRNDRISMVSGENHPLDLKLDIKNRWIHNDQLEFKLEVIQELAGSIESILVRCRTVSKNLSVYNRSYYCNVPGESTPLLTYRLSRKGLAGAIDTASTPSSVHAPETTAAAE